MSRENPSVFESVNNGLVSTIEGAGNVVQPVDTIGRTLGAVIKSTAEVGGDLGTAAKGLVSGASPPRSAS